MYVHVYERETAGTTPCDNLVLNQTAKPERERGKERDRERDRQTGTDRQTDRQTHTHTLAQYNEWLFVDEISALTCLQPGLASKSVSDR